MCVRGMRRYFGESVDIRRHWSVCKGSSELFIGYESISKC